MTIPDPLLIHFTFSFSIKERLLTMGYTADDLETHYDKDGWKWDTLLDQPRQLTETSMLRS